MKIAKLFLASALFCAASFSFADQAYDIMKKSTTLATPETSRATMKLDNIEKNGKVEHRSMRQFGHRVDGLLSTVFEFTAPASVKDTRVLQAEKNAKDDDRWIYLPSLRTVRRIPTNENTKNFVGCEFTYNDMSIRHVDLDTNEMVSDSVKITAANGKTYDCWEIKATPIKKSDVEFSYRLCYIDKISYLPMKFEYFDKKDPNKLIKTYTTDGYHEMKTSKGTYWFREGAVMKNEITGRSTHIIIDKPEFDIQQSNAYFTQAWLQTGKAK